MIICESTISEYTLNGKTMYNVGIVYRISNKGKELFAQLTVDPEANSVSIDNIGTEWTGSNAEAIRKRNLRRFAFDTAKKYACLCGIEGPNNFYRHVDCRR